MKAQDKAKADEIWDECYPKCSTLRETWRMAMEEYHLFREKEKGKSVVKESLTTQHNDLQYILRTANEIAEIYKKEGHIKAIGDFEVRLQELLLNYFPLPAKSITDERMSHMRNQALSVIELTKGFTTEPTDNAMKTLLEFTDYILELTNGQIPKK